MDNTGMVSSGLKVQCSTDKMLLSLSFVVIIVLISTPSCALGSPVTPKSPKSFVQTTGHAAHLTINGGPKTLSPSESSISTKHEIETQEHKISKRSAPLDLSSIPPEVVAYIMRGWREHSARQMALQQLEQPAASVAGISTDDLSVRLDLKTLKALIAAINRRHHLDRIAGTKVRLQEIGKRTIMRTFGLDIFL